MQLTSVSGQVTEVDYDAVFDVFTVNGTRISGELMRALGQDPLLNDGRVFQMERKDGTVIVRQCLDPEVIELFQQKTR